LRQQLQAGRPYIKLDNPGVIQNPLRFRFAYQNVGVRPARDLRMGLWVFSQSLNEDPVSEKHTSFANEVPIEVGTQWTLPTTINGENLPSMYVILLLEYLDPITGERFIQPYYMKWDSLKNGQLDLDFEIASLEDKTRILSYLANRNLLPDLARLED
jgi:hypothetical protein